MFNKPYARLGSVVLGLFLLASVLSFLAASGTQSSSKDRILYAVDSNRVALVKGTAHPLARPRFDQGRVNPERQFTGVALTFRLSAAQQSDMQELLREQQDRSSPNYHKWLTPEQYASRFGMTANDLAKVGTWLQSQGLTVERVARNHNEISFSGSVGQIEYALKTEIHNYSINGEQHIANASDVSLPGAFAGEALGVRGLNDFHPKPRLRTASAKFTSNLSGNHFVIPGDFATLYDLPSTINGGALGTGQTIAVVGQTLLNPSNTTTDLDAFRSAAGLPATSSTNFKPIQVPGTGTALACAGDETEADLDLEWSEGVATNATIKYVYAGLGSGTTCKNRTKNVFDALQYAITNNVAPIISISYGNCEANLGSSFVLTMQQWAQEANAQGQTISGPAGDSGAADCDTKNSATQGFAVDVPASIPEVTGVGGSEFTGDTGVCPPNNTCSASGAPADSPYWSGSTSLTSGASALEHIPEKTWNDSSTSLDAGGGGASTIFSKPSWQSGTGVPGDGKRDVPDIALNASNAHDPYLICSQDETTTNDPGATSCATGFRDNKNNLAAVGGTSAGAPTFAGLLALINQATGSAGLGNVNPMLYTLAASSPLAFHDITSGNNNVPCTAGSKNCPNGGTIGFSAGAGYDEVTGLGSIDVANLISAWTAVVPVGDFSLDGLVASAAAAGQAGTSKITITAMNGFTGTVNLTCNASSAAVTISCSLNPASVTFPATSGNTLTSTLSMTAAAGLRLPQGLPSRKSRFETASLATTSFGGLFAAVIVGGVSSRRKWAALFGSVLLAIVIAGVGCGGGGSSAVPKVVSPQTYIVTVTGTGTNSAGPLSHSTTVSFTVQ